MASSSNMFWTSPRKIVMTVSLGGMRDLWSLSSWTTTQVHIRLRRLLLQLQLSLQRRSEKHMNLLPEEFFTTLPDFTRPQIFGQKTKQTSGQSKQLSISKETTKLNGPTNWPPSSLLLKTKVLPATTISTSAEWPSRLLLNPTSTDTSWFLLSPMRENTQETLMTLLWIFSREEELTRMDLTVSMTRWESGVHAIVKKEWSALLYLGREF